MRCIMTLDEIIQDIHALEEHLLAYERKFGVLSETFYQSYTQGEEPPNAAWVLDWSDWAASYHIWLQRKEKYQNMVQSLQNDLPLPELIRRMASREPVSIIP